MSSRRRWPVTAGKVSAGLRCTFSDIRDGSVIRIAALGRDPLTGALARDGLHAALHAACVAAIGAGAPVGVLTIDLDHFRMLNDVHGPDAGDRVLVAVASALADHLRAGEALGRVGSDEFAVVLPGAGVEAARAAAEGLIAAVRGVRLGDVHVTASIGAASATGLTPPELLAEADGALLEAKRGGRDRIAFAHPGRSAREEAAESLGWVARVRRALETGGLELHAQPIAALDPAAREPERHELLVRLRGDNGLPVAPAAFLPAAERFGQIQAIDGWMVGRALDLLTRTGPAGPTLHVNLAPASLGDAELMAFIERAVVAAGVRTDRLVFEITETAALGDVGAARATVDRLRALGCAIAIDDFGMGFGSFSHLKLIPFDILKIAGEFVHEITESTLDRLTVRAVGEVAHGMGMRTVAEYVGDEPTAQLLRSLGIDYAQGFHMGPPCPAAELWPE